MEVIVYTQQNCGYCHEQKEFLISNRIKFEERDILESEVFFNEFKQLEGQGTPFTIKKIKGKITSEIVGFNKEQLLKLLK